MEKEIDTSRKHLGLKIVLFVILLVTGLTFMTLGLLGVFSFSKGYVKVDLDTSDNNLKKTNISYFTYVDGNKIKRNNQLSDIKGIYNSEFSKIYMLVDEENSYSGIVNIKYLNDNLNKDIQVDSLLYSILSDSYTKTKEKKNYSIFSSYLTLKWDEILKNDLINDPIDSKENQEDINLALSYINNLDNFTLEFKKDNVINLSISEDYLNYRKENEITTPIISLGILKDSYIINHLKDTLNEKTTGDGYLISTDGYISTLKNFQGESINIASVDSLKVTNTLTIDVNKNSSYVYYYYFDYFNLKAYRIKDKEGNYKYRYRIYSLNDGEASSFATTLLTEGNDLLSISYNLLYITSLNEIEARNYSTSNNLSLLYIKDDKKINLLNIDSKTINIIDKNYSIN